MTEAEWLTENRRPQLMVGELRSIGKVSRTKVGKRKLRLFACGCCRLVWDLLTEPSLRQAVEVAERFAEANASKEELQGAFRSILGLTMGGYNPDDPGVQARTAAHMALSATASSALSCAFDMTALPLPIAGRSVGGMSGETILCNLFRCVFSNPFRPVGRNPAWCTPTVVAIAQTIYDDRRFADLPILADALEEAGCTSADLLGHLRGPGPHVRGCWAVDLILAKE